MAVIAILILAVVFWGQYALHNLRAKFSYARALFFFLLVFYLFVGIKTSYDQYVVWQIGGPPSSYFLPPYQPISYFLFYSFMRFLLPALVAFLFAALFIFAARLMNKKFQHRFFYKDEPYIAGAGILAVGYPALFLYIPIVLCAVLISTIALKTRASAYYVWIPAAILVILTNAIWLSHLGIWNSFRM